MSSIQIDESPLVEAFRNPETVAHLESLIHLDPKASSWRFEVSCTPMGNWIEDSPATKFISRWSAQWSTEPSATAFERLTPPGEAIESLSAHLTRIQHAHTEAVGGPMDGVGYHLEVSQAFTLLRLLY